MMRRFALNLSLGLFVFLGLTARAQVSINPEAEQFRQNVETKLLRTLETYLGERSKVLVSAHFILPDPNAPEKNLDADGKAVASTETWLDLGYVTTPGEPSVTDNSGKLQIASTQVDIRVSEKLDDAELQQIQLLATNSLQGLNPQIRIEKVSFPLPFPKDEPKVETKDAVKPAAPLDPIEKLLQKYGALVPLVAALVVGLGLLLASTSASRMMANAASEIAAGIRGMRPTVTTNPDKPINISSSGLGGEDLSKASKAVPPMPPRLREHFRNVAFIKKMLSENPLPLARALTDSSDDLRGIRWLLTNLSEDERRTLQKFLSSERLLALSELPNDGETPWDSSAWLQVTVENLVVREIAGGSAVEKALKADQSFRISSADPDLLFKLVREFNEASTWRVALEFLPKDRVLSALKESDTNLWQTLFAGSALEPAVLQEGAEKILSRLGTESSGPASNNADERKRFYSNILLDPAVDSVMAKALGDDDLFLDEISQMAPEFVQLLRKKVWTPRSLDRVSDVSLKDAFSGLSSAQKTALLLAFPGELSDRLQTYLPEGTGRTIVLDQLRRAREKSDGVEIESATRLAREFLDFMRKQADEGKVTLKASEDTVSDVIVDRQAA